MNLPKKEENKVVGFYKRSLEFYGEDSPDAHVCQWGSSHGQFARFNVLFEHVDLQGKTLLDVGSGLGSLYNHILRRKLNVKYAGIDLVEDFVGIAKKRYPDAEFIHGNITNLTGQYDVVYCSGALTYVVENNNRYYFDIVKKMFDLAKDAVLFNMLWGKTWPGSIYARYIPSDVARFCKTFCNSVEVITGYEAEDFSILLRKNENTKTDSGRSKEKRGWRRFLPAS